MYVLSSSNNLGADDRFLCVLQLEARSLFFFFQAEDGIRDVAVTGVQTCALPISSSNPLPRYQATSRCWGRVFRCRPSRILPPTRGQTARFLRNEAAGDGPRSNQ